MAKKVKLSKDGNSIDFVQSESLPTSVKKFRQSPEIEAFYRFAYENQLQQESYKVLCEIADVKNEALVNSKVKKTKTRKKKS